MQMEARSMAIEADKRSASSSVPKATDNLNAADKTLIQVSRKTQNSIEV
jgi:hypothetical protein